ncbi:MAG: hypothetical protein MdMp014T_2783 [Treponematales bacterium]
MRKIGVVLAVLLLVAEIGASQEKEVFINNASYGLLGTAYYRTFISQDGFNKYETLFGEHFNILGEDSLEAVLWFLRQNLPEGSINFIYGEARTNGLNIGTIVSQRIGLKDGDGVLLIRWPTGSGDILVIQAPYSVRRVSLSKYSVAFFTGKESNFEVSVKKTQEQLNRNPQELVMLYLKAHPQQAQRFQEEKEAQKSQKARDAQLEELRKYETKVGEYAFSPNAQLPSVDSLESGWRRIPVRRINIYGYEYGISNISFFGSRVSFETEEGKKPKKFNLSGDTQKTLKMLADFEGVKVSQFKRHEYSNQPIESLVQGLERKGFLAADFPDEHIVAVYGIDPNSGWGNMYRQWLLYTWSDFPP